MTWSVSLRDRLRAMAGAALYLGDARGDQRPVAAPSRRGARSVRARALRRFGNSSRRARSRAAAARRLAQRRLDDVARRAPRWRRGEEPRLALQSSPRAEPPPARPRRGTARSATCELLRARCAISDVPALDDGDPAHASRTWAATPPRVRLVRSTSTRSRSSARSRPARPGARRGSQEFWEALCKAHYPRVPLMLACMPPPHPSWRQLYFKQVRAERRSASRRACCRRRRRRSTTTRGVEIYGA